MFGVVGIINVFCIIIIYRLSTLAPTPPALDDVMTGRLDAASSWNAFSAAGWSLRRVASVHFAGMFPYLRGG